MISVNVPWRCLFLPGWPDVFVKKSPKDNEKSPKWRNFAQSGHHVISTLPFQQIFERENRELESVVVKELRDLVAHCDRVLSSPGPNVIKLFAAVIDVFTRKNNTRLERLARDKCSSLLWKGVTYCRKKFYRIGSRPNVIKLSASAIYVFTRKHQTRLERLARGKRYSLLWKGVTYCRKKFYRIGSTAQCYKTFCGRNLRFYPQALDFRLERLARDKRSRLLRKGITYCRKKPHGPMI